jgi:hypothetical protein
VNFEGPALVLAMGVLRNERAIWHLVGVAAGAVIGKAEQSGAACSDECLLEC